MNISMTLGNAYAWLREHQSEQLFIAYGFIGGISSIASLALICVADWFDTRIVTEARRDFEKAKSPSTARKANESIFSKAVYAVIVLAVFVHRKFSTPAQIEAAKLARQKIIEDAALAKQERGLKDKEWSQWLKARGRILTAVGIVFGSLALIVKPDAPIANCQPVLKPSVTRADLIDPRNINAPMPRVLLIPCYSRG